jgi:heme/copper-type cytochrome/quinol oxidase subunit 2
MVKIIKFHENCMLVVIFVLIIVFILLIFNLINLFVVTNKLEKEIFEISWTLIPTLIIIRLMVPSLELLYFSEETGGIKTKNSVKIIGHQWY